MSVCLRDISHISWRVISGFWVWRNNKVTTSKQCTWTMLWWTKIEWWGLRVSVPQLPTVSHMACSPWDWTATVAVCCGFTPVLFNLRLYVFVPMLNLESEEGKACTGRMEGLNNYRNANLTHSIHVLVFFCYWRVSVFVCVCVGTVGQWGCDGKLISICKQPTGYLWVCVASLWVLSTQIRLIFIGVDRKSVAPSFKLFFTSVFFIQLWRENICFIKAFRERKHFKHLVCGLH